MRDNRWKLITYPNVKQMRLFDLQIDPEEIRNLAGLDAHGERVTRMQQLLSESQRKFRVPLATAANYAEKLSPQEQ